MKPFWTRNLSNSGRLARGLCALALFLAAALAWGASWWLGAALAAAGAFTLFEALRGWCVLRACGIKTRL